VFSKLCIAVRTTDATRYGAEVRLAVGLEVRKIDQLRLMTGRITDKSPSLRCNFLANVRSRLCWKLAVAMSCGGG